MNLKDDIVEQEPWAARLPRMDLEALADQMDEVEKRSRDLGLPCQFVPFASKASMLDFYAGHLAYEQYACAIPWTTMRISPTGDVFPCLNYRVGSIRQGSLLALWNHPRYRAFRNRMGPRGLYQSCAGCCKMTPRRVNGMGASPGASGITP
jgi:MoaA/NifB/PqqE/SkfB family radical SAM enzyme